MNYQDMQIALFSKTTRLDTKDFKQLFFLTMLKIYQNNFNLSQ